MSVRGRARDEFLGAALRTIRPNKFREGDRGRRLYLIRPADVSSAAYRPMFPRL